MQLFREFDQKYDLMIQEVLDFKKQGYLPDSHLFMMWKSSIPWSAVLVSSDPEKWAE